MIVFGASVIIIDDDGGDIYVSLNNPFDGLNF
jgi:hypothetical protein